MLARKTRTLTSELVHLETKVKGMFAGGIAALYGSPLTARTNPHGDLICTVITPAHGVQCLARAFGFDISTVAVSRCFKIIGKSAGAVVYGMEQIAPISSAQCQQKQNSNSVACS
jgi:hypothetical protein